MVPIAMFAKKIAPGRRDPPALRFAKVGRGLRTRRAHVAARRGVAPYLAAHVFLPATMRKSLSHSIYNEDRVTCSDVCNSPGTPRSLK